MFIGFGQSCERRGVERIMDTVSTRGGAWLGVGVAGGG